VDTLRAATIREQARLLQMRLWTSRSALWETPPADPADLLPIDLERIASGLLHLRLEEPEEIPNESEGSDELIVETAGFLDRREGRIVVAQKFPLEWRRFTLAHEIGHVVLHPGLHYHRDRPLSGGERANRGGRPAIELEADLFGAELLMPSRHVERFFRGRYGEIMHIERGADDLAQSLSAGTGLEISPSDLLQKGIRFAALIVAQNSTFGGRHFASLASRFGVSPTAMAIQLEDLRLISMG
jgi:Zn-dependent peptidase ImmA (M78 family)